MCRNAMVGLASTPLLVFYVKYHWLHLMTAFAAFSGRIPLNRKNARRMAQKEMSSPVRRRLCFVLIYLLVFLLEPSTFPVAKADTEFQLVTRAESAGITQTSDSSSASRSEFDYAPTLVAQFYLNITAHTNASANLWFGRVELQQSVARTLYLARNGSGLLRAYLNNTLITSASFNISKMTWYKVVISYATNNDTLMVTIQTEGSGTVPIQVVNRLLDPPFRRGIAFTIGWLSHGFSSPGSVLVKNFRLDVSPMLNISLPVSNPGDTVSIKGIQFDPYQNINVTIASLINQAVYSNPSVPTDGQGKFDISLQLPQTLKPGLYHVFAKQPYGPRVKFHLGVWGLGVAQANRTLPINFTGSGFRIGSIVRVTMRRTYPAYFFSEIYTVSGTEGTFASTKLTFPPSFPLGAYSVLLEAYGTLDYFNYPFSDAYEINIGKAPLFVTVETSQAVYLRTQLARIYANARYANGSRIPSVSAFTLNVKQGANTVIAGQVMTYDPGLQKWSWGFILVKENPIGIHNAVTYAVDPYGNTGSGTGNFEVKPAQLKVDLYDNKTTYQRSETISINANLAYPDGSPATTGTYLVVGSIGTVTHSSGLIYETKSGLWKSSIMILPGDPVGTWKVTMSGSDPQGNLLNYSFGVTILAANLNITIIPDVNATYQRTQSVSLQLVAKYPSGQVLSVGTLTANATRGQGLQTYSSVLQFNSQSQLWKGALKLPANAPIDMYLLVVKAVDQFGNAGNQTRRISVVAATLKLNISTPKKEFQIGFESVKLSGAVFYPDGTALMSGNVSAKITVGASSKAIIFTQESGIWTGSLQTGFFDPGGDYLFVITASDVYDNSGSVSLSLTGSQLYVALSLVGIILAIAIAAALIWRYRQMRTGAPSPVEAEYYL